MRRNGSRYEILQCEEVDEILNFEFISFQPQNHLKETLMGFTKVDIREVRGAAPHLAPEQLLFSF